jgi:catechol 2,3-dioxygenase-like lactoylglutathione lyase family enzyme
MGKDTIVDLVPFVRVADVERSIAFYEALGFAVIKRYDRDGTLEFAGLEATASAKIMLARADTEPAGDPDAESRGFLYLYTPDLDAFRERLLKSGIDPGKIEEGPGPGQSRELCVIDPDGHGHMVAELWDGSVGRDPMAATLPASEEETTPSIAQANLETIMIDFFGALRRGNLDAAAALLDPDVVWQGLHEDWRCEGREAVLDTFRWGLEAHREIEGLELARSCDRVVLGARGPSITEVGDEPLEGQIFNVFTLREGRIVRIDDYPARGEAFAAAGVAADAGWRV